MKHKKCPRCSTWKSRDEYYKCSSKASGLQTKCKACTSAMRKEWKKRPESKALLKKLNKEYYDRKGHATKAVYDRSERGASLHRIHAEKYRTRHPEKAAAHAAVLRAVQSGKLTRGPCEVCGTTKVHGHHDDYSKPLAVRWLCAVHHAQRHKELSL